jgi:hypothetical protein
MSTPSVNQIPSMQVVNLPPPPPEITPQQVQQQNINEMLFKSIFGR